jgi:hypothetical protein
MYKMITMDRDLLQQHNIYNDFVCMGTVAVNTSGLTLSSQQLIMESRK